MMTLVLRTLKYLMTHIRHPLLPTRSVHHPIYKLMHACVETNQNGVSKVVELG